MSQSHSRESGLPVLSDLPLWHERSMHALAAALADGDLAQLEAITANSAPLERLQFERLRAMTPSLNTEQTETGSESRHPDSNRGPLHYESKPDVSPSPETTTQSAGEGDDEPPLDHAGQPKRLQNASSSSTPATAVGDASSASSDATIHIRAGVYSALERAPLCGQPLATAAAYVALVDAEFATCEACRQEAARR